MPAHTTHDTGVLCRQTGTLPAQRWQATCLPEVIPHAQVPANLRPESAWADARVSCEVSTERDNDPGCVGVQPAVCLAPERSPSRPLPGHFAAAIPTNRVFVHWLDELVAQVCQHLVRTGEGHVRRATVRQQCCLERGNNITSLERSCLQQWTIGSVVGPVAHLNSFTRMMD